MPSTEAPVANKPSPAPQAELQADTLKLCLLDIMRHYHRDFSAETLLNGLPLQNNRLTPQLFVRAASRAGFKATVLQRRLDKISPHVLPAVLLTQSKQALILKEKLHDGSYVVYDPVQHAEKTYNASEKLDDYSGYVILIHPAYDDADLGDASLKSGSSWFWSTFKLFRPLYIKVIVSAVFINLFALASSFFVMLVYDKVVGNDTYETLWVLATGVALIYLFDFLFKQLRTYFIDIAGRSADILLASKLFQQVMNIRLGVQGASSGAFANQLREFESLREFFASATLASIIDFPFVLLFILVVALIGGPIALVFVIAIPMVIFISFMIQRPMRAILQRAHKDMDAKHGHLVESITALETIKSLGAQSRMQAMWERYVGMTARIGLHSKFLSSLGVNAAVLVQQLVYVIVVIWGVYRINDQLMSMGALIACTILTGRIMAPLGQAAGIYIRYQQAKLSLAALNNIMHMEVERPDRKQYVPIRRFRGEIEFKDVSFKYPNSELDSLKEVSFTIKPGERVAIIGRTGSGKSTILRMLLNLYNPDEGSLLVDGLEIRQLDPAELRSYIGYVPQDVVLFKGSLRENLLISKHDASEDHLVGISNICGVSEFVRRHPKGFDMQIAEGGGGLSGGQRQAVAIGRALMKNPQILVMDEPTSNMDNRSEEILKRNFRNWMRDNRTLVLVTHRTSLLDLVNRIIILDQGRVVMDGPKHEVLENLQRGQVQGAQS